MSPRRPRRAPPTSRLTRTARVALGVILVGVVVLRSGWALFSRGDGPLVPLVQEGPAPGRVPAEPEATPSAAAAPTSRTAMATAIPTLGRVPDEGGAAARLVATAELDGRVANGWLTRDPVLGVDIPTVTIDAPGQTTRRIAWSRLDPRAGTDVTGDGRADLVIERDTGGMGCCWSLWVYEVEPSPPDQAAGVPAAAAPGSVAAVDVDGLTGADAEALGLRPALRLPLSRCRGALTDVDGDGSLEVVTCDSSVPLALCPALEGADPEIVLRYVEGRGYVPATPRFRSSRPAAADPAASSAPAAADPCSALPAVLAASYAGRDAAAAAAMAKVPDAAAFGRRVASLMKASPLYAAPDGDAAAVIVTDEAP